MKKNKWWLLLVFAGVFTLFTSCTDYQKIMKSGDTDAIFAEAMRLYENGSYAKTLQLFDKIAVFVKGTDKEEPLSYYYAQCYYQTGEYTLASYYFKKYIRQYPFTERAEECAYLSALCKYYQSPVYSLDQTPTNEAIKEMQSFINNYPLSPKIEECNGYIDELWAKLEEKDFRIAMMYFKMEEYKAAIVCFKNILKDYPNTSHKEIILCNIVKAGYEYARNSVPLKQRERFKEMVENYQKFISTFPDSQYIKEIEHYYKIAVAFV
ncbi:MAG: outer membrane protein assembly factor BamD [Bacteroidales bacterium]|nr:outer membrane protein assembly factor BamD [Bacteroidales bacterium]